MTEITQTPNPTAEQVRELTQSPARMPLMYFNLARTASSFFDVRVFFGQASVTPKGEPTFEEQLCIVMAPEFAKLFHSNLGTALSNYETRFGVIRNASQATATIEAPVADGKSEKKRRKPIAK